MDRALVLGGPGHGSAAIPGTGRIMAYMPAAAACVEWNKVMLPAAMLASKPRGPVALPVLVPAGFSLDSLQTLSTKSFSESPHDLAAFRTLESREKACVACARTRRRNVPRCLHVSDAVRVGRARRPVRIDTRRLSTGT